jgi:hypothetical protein
VAHRVPNGIKCKLSFCTKAENNCPKKIVQRKATQL